MPLTLHTIYFDLSKWTTKKATEWIKQHNYKLTYYGKTPDITPTQIRFRQKAPDSFV